MVVETWPYWIEFALSVIAFAAFALLSYGSPAELRKYKLISALCVYGIMIGVTGFLALGLTYFDREDGITVQWGRWAMFAATHGAVALVVAQSMSYAFIDWALAFLLGTASAVFLVIGMRVPARNCGNSFDASILATVLSGVCVIAVSVLVLCIARKWPRFGLFPMNYNSSNGRVNVMSSWWLTVVSVVLFFCLSLYTFLFALGPEGIPTSCKTGDSNNTVYTSEWTQIWLLLALADGLVKFLALPIVFFFVNPDGQTSSTAFEVLQPAAQVMPMGDDMAWPPAGMPVKL